MSWSQTKETPKKEFGGNMDDSEGLGRRKGWCRGGRWGGSEKMRREWEEVQGLLYFDPKTFVKTERPIRQRNTWRGGLSDWTIWCESGFDSGHKTDWLRSLSAGSSWQRNTMANQSSHQSSRVWALLIIIPPRARNQFVLFSIRPSLLYTADSAAPALWL